MDEMNQLAMESHLLTAVAQHHQLSDLVTGKDWYHPFLTTDQQVGKNMRMAGNVTSQ